MINICLENINKNGTLVTLQVRVSITCIHSYLYSIFSLLYLVNTVSLHCQLN